MNPYSANVDTQRTVWGTLWKGIVCVALGISCLVVVLFVLCRSRVDRSSYQEALNRAHRIEDVRQLDLLLLPRFEKTPEGIGHVRYTAKPSASGLCRCAPAMVDVVEVAFDGSGQVTSLSVSQSIGLPQHGEGT